MKYKVGDRFEDMRSPGVIEVTKVTPKTSYSNAGYEITIDGVEWEYGITEHYLDANCTKLN